MGIGEIMEAKKLLTIIGGSRKEAAATKLLLTDEITTACPVTMIKVHPDSTVLLTKELADKIKELVRSYYEKDADQAAIKAELDALQK